MADSIEALQKTSKKRKQSPLSTNPPSDNPFSGVLTRQKNQKYFFSHNRSGKSRICRSSKQSSTQTATESEPQLDVDWAAINANGKGDGDGEIHVSIKDLRARRVFSKPPKNQTVGKDVNPSCDSELIDCKVEFNNEFGENPSSSIEKINGFRVNSKGEGVDSGNPNSIFEDLIAVNHDLSMLSKNRDDCWLNLVVEDLDVENPNLLLASEKCDSVIDTVNPNSTVVKKFDEYKVNSMAMDLDVKTPNFSVVSEKCDSVINGANLSSAVLKKCVNSGVGNPELQVLKKCDSGGNVENPSLSVSDKFDGSSIDLLAEGLKGGDLDQLLALGNCEAVINRGHGNLFDKRDSGVGCVEKVSDDVSPNVGNGFVKGGVGGSCEIVNEENLQSTPPDAVFIIRKSPTKQTSLTKDGSSEVKNVSSSMNGMTLNKCSRRKVFKVPNSFTYKRLLPYLMDMGKDEPCTMKANPIIKIENNVEEKPFVSLSEESTMDATKLPEKLLDTTAACVPEEVSIDRVDEFSTDANASKPLNCCADESLTNLANSETQIPDNPGKGVTKDEHVSPDNLAVTFQSSKTSLEVPMKDNSVAEPPSHLSVVSRGEFVTEESLISRSQSSDKLATLEHVAGLAKGILKRNPRGCRGICSCLDCSSFRLNADKAFEFSRNQLLEAEEVAQDLMKELSNLKCMLKKSVTGTTDVNQVEEACIRASNVEDMAKSRLRQMHEDLYVHTRSKAMLRPRVNFSINVQKDDHLI